MEISLKGNIMRYFNSISAILILILSVGCASPGFKQRPESVKQKNSISVIADVSVIEDILGYTDGIYIHKNMEVGEVVVKEASLRLKERGYEVKEEMVSTIGSWLEEGANYKVVQDGSTSSAPKLFGDTGKPPFYINDFFLKDERQRQSLISVHRNPGTIIPASYSLIGVALLHKGVYPPTHHKAVMEGSPIIIPEVKDLGLKGDALLIIGVMGKQVPVLKEIGTSIGSALAGGGATQQSYLYVSISLIDLNSGEVVWGYMENAPNSEPSSDKASALVNNIMGKFPVRK
jgi:hypothetical protein